MKRSVNRAGQDEPYTELRLGAVWGRPFQPQTGLLNAGP